MADYVELEPHLLRNAAERTAAVRDGIDGVIDALDAALQGRGAPWGGDKIGDQFAEGDEGYKAAAENLFEGARNVADAMGKFSGKQSDAADLLESQEQANEDGFR